MHLIRQQERPGPKGFDDAVFRGHTCRRTKRAEESWRLDRGTRCGTQSTFIDQHRVPRFLLNLFGISCWEPGFRTVWAQVRV